MEALLLMALGLLLYVMVYGLIPFLSKLLEV